MTCKIAELTSYSFFLSILISLSYSCPKGYNGSPCKDIEPPALSCPGPIIKTSTGKGKATAKVLWSIQVTDNSVQLDPNAVIQVRSSHKSGQEFPIGVTLVKVNAADETGNIETCVFNVQVEDTEPPSCSFCPADIVQEETTSRVRVTWERPICSDNSLSPPSISANRQIGAEFEVPSTTLVQYTVSDGLNTNNNCSFKVILKVKTCTMFPSPRNGALVCHTGNHHTACSAFCEKGADFEFNLNNVMVVGKEITSVYCCIRKYNPVTRLTSG